jgi:hypothetical protein
LSYTIMLFKSDDLFRKLLIFSRSNVILI